MSEEVNSHSLWRRRKNESICSRSLEQPVFSNPGAQNSSESCSGKKSRWVMHSSLKRPMLNQLRMGGVRNTISSLTRFESPLLIEQLVYSGLDLQTLLVDVSFLVFCPLHLSLKILKLKLTQLTMPNLWGSELKRWTRSLRMPKMRSPSALRLSKSRRLSILVMREFGSVIRSQKLCSICSSCFFSLPSTCCQQLGSKSDFWMFTLKKLIVLVMRPFCQSNLAFWWDLAEEQRREEAWL